MTTPRKESDAIKAASEKERERSARIVEGFIKTCDDDPVLEGLLRRIANEIRREDADPDRPLVDLPED